MASKKDHHGHQWIRIHNMFNLEPVHDKNARLNRAAFESQQFRNACSEAGIEPTIRQASKYRRKTGLAWAHRQ